MHCQVLEFAGSAIVCTSREHVVQGIYSEKLRRGVWVAKLPGKAVRFGGASLPNKEKMVW